MVNELVLRGVGACMVLAFCAPRSLAAQPVGPAEGEVETGAPVEAEDRAKSLFASGQEHYERGEFQAAVDAFREAQRLWPKPELLYNLAQAERLSGDCAAALEHYREFQASGLEKPADLAEKIAEMERCNSSAAAPVVNPTAQAPMTDSSKPAAPPLEPPRASDETDQGSTLRVLGWASLGGAALSAALGTIFALEANAARKELDEANRQGAQWSSHYESSEDSLARNRNLAIGFFIGAGVLAGTGGWLLLSPPTGSNGDGLAARVTGSF
jgi:hypothetical protein